MWAEDDKPSTKLVQKGVSALSGAEILSIIIGSGTRDTNSLEIARLILQECKNDINLLAKLNFTELSRLHGIGKQKAVKILASFELSRRRIDVMPNEKIAGSRDIYTLYASDFYDSQFESFAVVALNRANRIIKKVNVSEGGISGTVADPKKIFKMAMDCFASSVILMHNHPSGNIQPSEADIKLTKKLKEAGLLLDLPVLDHVIFGNASSGYYSFADEGML